MMESKFIEATNGPRNWGKFMVARFTDDEWSLRAAVDGGPLLRGRGWDPAHVLVVDLQTGEGAIFMPGGYAKADLDKHKIWVCPLFEPFLTWLYTFLATGDLADIPTHIDLPDAPFEMQGYRREGSS